MPKKPLQNADCSHAGRPTYAHKALAEACASHARDGQSIILTLVPRAGC